MKTRIITAGMLVLSLAGGCSSGSKATNDVPAPMAAPTPPPARKEPLNAPLRELAKREIREAFKSANEIQRANAVEAAQNVLGAEAIDVVRQALDDHEPLVRFAGAMATGKLQFAELHDRIAQLANDPNTKVKIGALYTLYRLGDTTRTRELEQTARDPNPRFREDTALVLGLLDNRSALKVLSDMRIDTDSSVRLQVAESMWRLRDEKALDVLGAGLVTEFVDDQMITLMALVGPHDLRVAEHVRGKLTSPYLQVQLVAARALGELGLDDGYSVAINALKSKDPSERALALLALGSIGRSDAQNKIAPFLNDPMAPVRLAAAQAMLQLKDSD